MPSRNDRRSIQWLQNGLSVEVDLPRDVDAFVGPLCRGELGHHEIGHVGSGDAAGVVWESFAIDADLAASGDVHEHGRHDHGPVEGGLGEDAVLGDLAGYGPLEEGVVDDVLDDPASPCGLLVEGRGEGSGRAEDDYAARAVGLHGLDDEGDGALEDVFAAEGFGAQGGEDGGGSGEGVDDRWCVEGAALNDSNAVAVGEG